MEPQSTSQASQGWFPDPFGRFELRWFNGATWTADVSTSGQRYVDPLGVTPNSPGSMAGGFAGGTPQRSRNGVATASVVMGSIAALISWVPFIVVIGIILAILAITLGIAGRRRAKAMGGPSGVATAGIVTGIVGLGGAIVGIWLSVIVIQAATAFLDPGQNVVSEPDCRIGDNEVSIAATVTNTSPVTRDYTVFVLPTRGDNTPPEPVALNDVEPGEERSFRVRFADSGDDTGCEVAVRVFGPLPFGIPIDPPDE